MSSFETPHHLYLFALRNGRKKLAYGPTPEAALEVLSLRLTEAERANILDDQVERIQQHELRQWVDRLG